MHRNHPKPLYLGLLLAVVFAGSLLPAAAGEEISRAPERLLSIFANTDSRGELVPCACPGLKFSGLALRTSVLKRARKLDHPALLVDGGDFVPGPDDSLRLEKAELMLAVMEDISYDAVAVGDLELLMDPAFLARAARKLPLVSANLEFPGEHQIDIPRVRWLEKGNYRIAVTSVLDPVVFYERPGAFEATGDFVTFNDIEESLKALVKEVRPKANMVVVLGHAASIPLAGYLENQWGIDVVVQGHEPEETDAQVNFPDFCLMVPGPGSRAVAQVTFEIAENDGVRPVRSRIWDLKQQTLGNKRVEKMVADFLEEHGAP